MTYPPVLIRQFLIEVLRLGLNDQELFLHLLAKTSIHVRMNGNAVVLKVLEWFEKLGKDGFITFICGPAVVRFDNKCVFLGGYRRIGRYR